MSVVSESEAGTLPLPDKNLVLGTKFSQSSGRLTSQGLQDLRTEIVEKLSNYPYFALVRDFPGVENANDLTRVVKQFGPFSRSFSLRRFIRGIRSSGRVTEIKIVPDFNMEGTNARTSSALEPHTDGSFHKDPFELVVLYCVESDGEGGDSIVIALDDIVERLDEDDYRALKAPVFPFGDNVVPVIGGAGGKETIRYYRTQLEMQLSRREGSFELAEGSNAALKALDQAMDDASIHFRFHLEPRDLLFVNNKKAVHARTGFSDDSSRLLLRARVCCRELA